MTLRHSLNEFSVCPNTRNFRRLYVFFEYMVCTIAKHCGIVKRWKKRCLIGYLFTCLGGYRKGNALDYFNTKLLMYMRRLYRLEKGFAA